MKRNWILFFIFFLSLSANAQSYDEMTLKDKYRRAYMDEEFARMFDTALGYFVAQDWNTVVPLLEAYCDDLKKYSFCDRYRYVFTVWISVGYKCLNRLEDAEALLVSTIEEMESKGYEDDNDCYLKLLDCLGGVYCNLKDFQRGYNCYEKTKFAYESKLDFGESYTEALVHMANCQRELGNYVVAKMLMNVAVRQMRKNLDVSKIETEWQEFNIAQEILEFKVKHFVRALSSCGALYSGSGYMDEALRFYDEAAELCKEYNVTDPFLFVNLAEYYISVSQYNLAIDFCDKALKCEMSAEERLQILFAYAFAAYLTNNQQCAPLSKQFSVESCDAISDMFSFLSNDQRAKYWSYYSIGLRNSN